LKRRVEGGVFGPELEFWERGETIVIGVDEAGRGPLAGPVVAAAAAFAPETIIPGIGDSKQMTALQREFAFPAIKTAALAYSIIRKDPDVIGEHNILGATRLAMKDAVDEVAAKLGSSNPVLLVDGRIPPLELGRQHNLIKGDSRSFSIGAASILAKVARDAIMAEYGQQYPVYGFAQHKGYPTQTHRNALFAHGRSPIHRLTFTILRPSGERVAIGDLPEWTPDE
jgi:ribonuclease HII